MASHALSARSPREFPTASTSRSATVDYSVSMTRPRGKAEREAWAKSWEEVGGMARREERANKQPVAPIAPPELSRGAAVGWVAGYEAEVKARG